MILSEYSRCVGSRCCSAASSETEWQRNESVKVPDLRPSVRAAGPVARGRRRALRPGVWTRARRLWVEAGQRAAPPEAAAKHLVDSDSSGQRRVGGPAKRSRSRAEGEPGIGKFLARALPTEVQRKREAPEVGHHGRHNTVSHTDSRHGAYGCVERAVGSTSHTSPNACTRPPTLSSLESRAPRTVRQFAALSQHVASCQLCRPPSRRPTRSSRPQRVASTPSRRSRPLPRRRATAGLRATSAPRCPTRSTSGARPASRPRAGRPAPT